MTKTPKGATQRPEAKDKIKRRAARGPRRDRRPDEAQRIAHRQRWLMAALMLFLAFAAVKPALGATVHPQSSWIVEDDGPSPEVADLWPVDREVRRHVFGREGFKAAEGFRPRLWSVEPTPFAQYDDPNGEPCCMYASAAAVVGLTGEDADEWGHLLGAISLTPSTARKLYARKPYAVHTLVHEYLHTVAPDAGEGLVDAVALDVVRNYYQAKGQPRSKAPLSFLHFAYWTGRGTISSGWVRHASAHRTGKHPDSRAAVLYRRSWLIHGKAPR